MLRIAGAVMIMGGCTAIGFFYKEKCYAGLKHLQVMQQILELFMSEIRYGKATLPECCGNIAKKVVQPYGQALEEIWQGTQWQSGSGFTENWRIHMEQALVNVPVSKREKEMFLGFASCCGLNDNRMQVRTVEQHRDMLASAVKARETEVQKQGKMAAGLGIMSGLLLTVVLI